MQTAYDNNAFDQLVNDCQEHFDRCVARYGDKVFTTAVDGYVLYIAYLSGFPDAEQYQIHTCNCCKQFFRNYGNLVFIDSKGELIPAIWPERVAGLYSQSIGYVRDLVKRSWVTGVFIFNEKTWKNTCGSGSQWTHFEIVPTGLTRVAPSGPLTPSQAMAEKVEDFNNICRARVEFRYTTVDAAIGLLESEALYRSEKIIGPAKFLRSVYGLRHTLLWKAVASAPAGFCHPRSGMIGTLLEDIEAGMAFDDVKRRFDEKMNPLKYQRQQAAPTAGNIKRAEELVAKMGIKDSLRRRHATYAEVREHAIWEPQRAAHVPSAREGSVFGHLLHKHDSPNLVLPQQTITLEKFVRTVLPVATKIDYLTDNHMDSFCSFLTAAVPDAPLIFQWDNPVSWYLYSGGSISSAWNLVYNSYVEVKGIVLQPNMWDRHMKHQGAGVLLVLEECRDLKSPGLCLFPEILKSELHNVRSTIEAFSSKGILEESPDEQLASGVAIQNSSHATRGYHLRVTSAIGTASYKIDRWD